MVVFNVDIYSKKLFENHNLESDGERDLMEGMCQDGPDSAICQKLKAGGSLFHFSFHSHKILEKREQTCLANFKWLFNRADCRGIYHTRKSTSSILTFVPFLVIPGSPTNHKLFTASCSDILASTFNTASQHPICNLPILSSIFWRPVKFWKIQFD